MMAYLFNYLISSSNNYKEGGLCCRCCCACFCLYNCCVTSSTLYWRMQSCRRQIGESSPGGSLSKVTIGRYTRFLSTLCSIVVHNDHQIIIAFSLASIAWFAGSYFSKPPPLLLVVHSTHTLNVYVRCWCSAEWYIFCWYSFYWSSPHYTK